MDIKVGSVYVFVCVYLRACRFVYVYVCVYVSAMPATQRGIRCHPVPCLPRKVEVHVTKCYASNAKLCVGELCVSELYVSELCVSEWCVCVCVCVCVCE